MNLFSQQATYLIALLKRLGAVLLLFSGIRLMFFIHNRGNFPLDAFGGLLEHMVYALHFDLSSLIYINSLLILGMLLPFQSRRKPLYRRILKIIFVGANGLAILFELTDVAYFPFNLRRSIFSDFALFQNTAEMIPGFLAAYWYLVICWIGILFLLGWIFEKTRPDPPAVYAVRWHFFIMLVSLPLLLIGARGGLQLRPVSPITAFEYVKDERLAPLITNTTMSLLFSSQFQQLEAKIYFSDERAREIFNLHRQYHDQPPAEKRNVFIIVLESFGTEHVGPNTPFLDSLLQHSLVMEDGYANGLRSTQGILAITASIPALMEQPLMFSAYQTNRVDGLAKILGDWGYTSGFFHGANPGSMEFERFARLSGFDHYYDRDEFGDDREYDGQWGIWDEPFFQYTVREVSRYEEPFFALLFSLTSHHPYEVPDWFARQYPTEKNQQLLANRYTDYALRSFFATASKLPWFEHTLFVITADHTGRSTDPYFQGNQGRYRIPIALYDPRQSFGDTLRGLAQQTDIMPTVLDYLGYDQEFPAFGSSMLDSTRIPMAYHFNGIWYHAMNPTYFYEFDGFTPRRAYNYRKDPELKNNLLATDTVPLALYDTLKAIIQIHHHGMLNNLLYLPEK